MSDTRPTMPAVDERDAMEAPCRRIAVICAPFKDRTLLEELETDRAIKHLTDLGWCPIFLPYALQRALSDHDPVSRRIALECSRSFVQHMSVLVDSALFVLPGRQTEGMLMDMDEWCGQQFVYSIRTISFTDADAP